jgi:hypothetical protein
MSIWESSPLADQDRYRCCICLASIAGADVAITSHHRAYCAECAPLCPPADWPEHFRSIADAPPRQRRLFAERRDDAKYADAREMTARPDLRLVPPGSSSLTCAECGRELGAQPGPLCGRCQGIANRDRYHVAPHYERGECANCGTYGLLVNGRCYAQCAG